MKKYIVKANMRKPLEDGTEKHLVDMSGYFNTHEEAEEFANKLGEERKEALGLKDSSIIRNKNFVTVNDFVDNVEWFYLIEEIEGEEH
jgi:hypothetical protein